MNRSLQVFLSAALGAFIGTVVALRLHQYWWVGMVVGAVVGYLSFEFKAVRQAIPQAWSAAVTTLELKWRLDHIRVAWELVGYSLISAAGVVAGILAIANFSPLHNVFVPAPSHSIWQAFVVTDVILVLSLSFIAFFLGLAAAATVGEGKQKEPWKAEDTRTMRIFYLAAINPLSMLIVVPIAIVGGVGYGTYRLVLLVPKVPRAIAFVGTFLWYLFKLIHSEIRLLCGVDAAIGALIGYLFGSPLIGALAGGLIGVLNYEIVSKRILHLVPAPNKS